MKVLYNDFDSLFERFSIMTIDGKLSDDKVMEYLKNKTTETLYYQLLMAVKPVVT